MKFDFFKKRDNASRAGRLQRLKREREKYEGKARLIKLEDKEKARISKARETIKQDSPLFKAKAKLQKSYEESKKKNQKRGLNLGGSSKLQLGGDKDAYRLGGSKGGPKL